MTNEIIINRLESKLQEHFGIKFKFKGEREKRNTLKIIKDDKNDNNYFIQQLYLNPEKKIKIDGTYIPGQIKIIDTPYNITEILVEYDNYKDKNNTDLKYNPFSTIIYLKEEKILSRIEINPQTPIIDVNYKLKKGIDIFPDEIFF